MSPERRRIAIELAICTVLVSALSVYGLYRMDYFDPHHADDVRMTDNTRTAYVAKNIAEGRGYVTDELPTFLIDFYAKQGKLHDAEWVNADRFPFTAYAIAALYKVTGTTSWQMGILGFNLITFVAFMVLLYWLTRVVWNDRWAALLAVGFALLHPLTYIYLYLKDADMMLLTAGVLLCLWRYLERPGKLGIPRALLTGTLMAWLVLARPQIGAGFVLAFAVLGLVRAHRLRVEEGWKPALRSLLLNEGIVGVATLAWMMPFIIHSLSTWGSPLFSANALYQGPLGTRFVMNTDTWWKYTEVGATFDTGALWEHARGQLIAKFTTSWIATLRQTVPQFALEMGFAICLIVWLGRRAKAEKPEPPIDDDERTRIQRVRTLGMIVLAVVLLNLAILPRYGAHHYGYRHYLSFFLVFLWLCCGRALLEIGKRIWPAALSLYEKAKPHWGKILLVAVVVLVAWNFNRRGQYDHHLFVKTSNFIRAHWVGCVVIFAAVLWGRALLRIPSWPRGVLLVAALVLFRYTPYLETKHLNLAWLPDDKRVWDVLRQEKGMVTSLAMQNEVGWASGRKNFPAPELPMHVYSFLLDHELEIQDIYIESPEAIAGPGGVFYYSAPGFEGYRRLEQFQGRVPGYEIVFHASARRGYPKYRVKPRQKSSLVYRLTDRAAVQAMLKSPERIELGDVRNVIHTAYGWGEYFHIDGKPAVVATADTRQRYLDLEPTDRPWEDSSVTFFIDEKRWPTSVELEIYAPQKVTLDFFWNNDLYYFNTQAERANRSLGSYEVTQPGWQTVRLPVPPHVLRNGLNKLGFRVSAFTPVGVCPPASSETTCMTNKLEALEPRQPEVTPEVIVRDAKAVTSSAWWVSVFVGSLTFRYDRPPR